MVGPGCRQRTAALLHGATLGAGVESEASSETEAAESAKTLQGSICLRYHDQTPKELMLKAIDVMRTGIGYPALFNDKALEDAVRMLEFVAGRREEKYRIDGYRDFTADFPPWDAERVASRLYGKGARASEAAHSQEG